MAKILKCMQTAWHGGGRSKKTICYHMGISYPTLNRYMRGESLVPEYRRLRMNEAIGAPVDWEAYPAEFAAMQAEPAPPAPVDPPPPAAPVDSPISETAEAEPAPPAAPVHDEFAAYYGLE